jgi:hypothetical protein
MGIADAASDLSPELAKKLRDVQVLRKMFQQPVMLMLPYRVEVK